MSPYVIVEIDIVDPTGYEEYKKLAGATVEKYGGKYIVRGGPVETSGRRLETKAHRRARIRIRASGQRVAQLRRIPRAAKDAASNGQNENDRCRRRIISRML